MKKSNRTNTQRRAILKSAAITSGVIGVSNLGSEKWMKPVINSVILPAHATTSTLLTSGVLPGEVGSRYLYSEIGYSLNQNQLGLAVPLAMQGSTAPEAKFADKLLDLFVPTAMAELTSTGFLQLYLEITADGVFRFVFFLNFQDPDSAAFVLFYADSPVRLGSNSIPISLCDQQSSELVVIVNSLTATAANITLGETGGETFNLEYNQDSTPPENLVCNLT